MDTKRLCELTSAADSLQLKPLVDLTSRALARIIEGKTPEEIREIFHLPDDLTEVPAACEICVCFVPLSSPLLFLTKIVYPGRETRAFKKLYGRSTHPSIESSVRKKEERTKRERKVKGDFLPYYLSCIT